MIATHDAASGLDGVLWIAQVDRASFQQPEPVASGAAPFDHWLGAGRLFVRPDLLQPSKYRSAIERMLPGEPVLACDPVDGIVALGRIRYPKDMRTARDHAESTLYPETGIMVHSVAVHWDTSVRRSLEAIAQSGVTLPRHTLRGLTRPSQLRSYLLQLIQNGRHQDAGAAEVLKAAPAPRMQPESAVACPTRTQITQARAGQGIFRKKVLAREPVCRLTRIAHPDYLVASHIKPWAVCDEGEHLDAANGLMLAPHVDHLFDAGLISFTDGGQLLLAPALDRAILRAWHIDEGANVGPFAPDQARYLAYHRVHVLGQPRPRRLLGEATDAPESSEHGAGYPEGAYAAIGAG